MDARAALLTRLVDDAGLFPPAQKPMEQAVADHGADRAGPHGWMLGRFLCPASRLRELAAAAPDADGWTLGVVFDGTGDDWLAAVRGDLARAAAYDGPARVGLLEVRLPANSVRPETIGAFVAAVGAAGLSEPVDAFLEVPPGDEAGMVATLEAIAHVRATLPAGGAVALLGAKLRCGGITAELYPPPEQIAAFIATARRLAIPFKATAGLHHPFRHRDERVGVLQYGFVNLLAATALALDDLVGVVADPESGAFAIDADGLRWRGHGTDATGVARARELFTAYGSCSFAEPVEDLIAYGVLPVPVPVREEAQHA
jgi:hypothetical protein